MKPQIWNKPPKVGIQTLGSSSFLAQILQFLFQRIPEGTGPNQDNSRTVGPRGIWVVGITRRRFGVGNSQQEKKKFTVTFPKEASKKSSLDVIFSLDLNFSLDFIFSLNLIFQFRSHFLFRFDFQFRFFFPVQTPFLAQLSFLAQI